jgi:hypothetical protein
MGSARRAVAGMACQSLEKASDIKLNERRHAPFTFTGRVVDPNRHSEPNQRWPPHGLVPPQFGLFQRLRSALRLGRWGSSTSFIALSMLLP